VQVSTHERASWSSALAEVLATGGLIAVVLALADAGRSRAATTVSAYVFCACWFASSTGFVNPAVTLGRMLSDTLTGIAPRSALVFAVAQLAGGCLAWFVLALVTSAKRTGLAPRAPDAVASASAGPLAELPRPAIAGEEAREVRRPAGSASVGMRRR
jgi:uncharacterized oligopeptide transporter (OPT) family protein